MTKTGMAAYRLVCVDGEWRGAHRVTWEEHNGTIPDGMIIHHVDGNSRNNDIENLQMMSPGDHARLHNVKHFPPNVCQCCGEEYDATPHRKRRKFCSRACSYEHRRGNPLGPRGGYKKESEKKTKQVNVYMTQDEYVQMQSCAQWLGLTVSATIRKWLRQETREQDEIVKSKKRDR